MASTNKTPKLGLNQWAAGDEVLRTDFNGDNAKIDAAVKSLEGNTVFGSFVGNGAARREIVLGFRARFVLLVCYQGSNLSSTMFFRDITLRLTTGLGEITDKAYLTDTGFVIDSFSNLNGNNMNSHYIALR